MSPPRDESGFTLTELLVAMTVGIVVMFGILGLLDTTVSLSAKTTDRIQATADVRRGMDLVTRQVRSQVCLSGDPSAPKPALIAATPDSMTFYASLAPESPTLTIQRRKVEYVPGAGSGPGTITETVENQTPGQTRPNITSFGSAQTRSSPSASSATARSRSSPTTNSSTCPVRRTAPRR